MQFWSWVPKLVGTEFFVGLVHKEVRTHEDLSNSLDLSRLWFCQKQRILFGFKQQTNAILRGPQQSFQVRVQVHAVMAHESCQPLQDHTCLPSFCCEMHTLSTLERKFVFGQRPCPSKTVLGGGSGKVTNHIAAAFHPCCNLSSEPMVGAFMCQIK